MTIQVSAFAIGFVTGVAVSGIALVILSIILGKRENKSKKDKF